MMKILIVGASGYIGSRLAPAAVAAGHTVFAGARDPQALERFWWAPQVTPVELDVTNAAQTNAAVQAMDAVVYLVHSMAGEDFQETDLAAAVNMRNAVDSNAVARVVYLSGIIPPVQREELSEHLESRLQVEEVLGAAQATVVALRAAMIVGAASTSFEVLAQLSRRLPITVVPDWMDSLVEPVATTDVVSAVLAALTYQGPSRSIDLGGGERLPYSELLRKFADAAGINRPQLTVPLLPESLVAAVASRLIDVPTSTVATLMGSLQHDMIAKEEERELLLPTGSRVGVDDALRRALDPGAAEIPAPQRDPLALLPGDPDWADDPGDHSG